jgi:hypothetical protein
MKNATKSTGTAPAAAPPRPALTATTTATTNTTARRKTNNATMQQNQYMKEDDNGRGTEYISNKSTKSSTKKKKKKTTTNTSASASTTTMPPRSSKSPPHPSPRRTTTKGHPRPDSSSAQTAPAVLATYHGINSTSPATATAAVPSTTNGSVSSTTSSKQSSHVTAANSSVATRGTTFSNKTTTALDKRTNRGKAMRKSTLLSSTTPDNSNQKKVQISTTTTTTTTTNMAPTQIIVEDASSSISNASAPAPTSSSASSKKSRRRGLASLFKFRGKRREHPQGVNKPTIYKSKSALLTEFSLLMNEFPAQDALNTTLHVACLKHYSEELIVDQLIAKGPTAVSMRNQKKDLPLHCALKCKEGIGVENGVYDALVGIYPVGIQAVNVDGCLPIHLACQSGGRNLYVIQKLVEAYPLGVLQRCDLKFPFGGSEHLSFRHNLSLGNSGSGSNSSDWDVGSHEKGGGSGVSMNDSFSSEHNTPKKYSDKQEMTWGASFWSALIALSPLSSSSGDQMESSSDINSVADPGMESSFTPLHLAVMNGAPPDVIGTLLDFNPLCLSIKTDRGRTPLDIAEFLIAESHHTSRIQQDVKVDKEHEYYLDNIDRDPIQNVMAAREILKAFQRNHKKSMRLIQAAKMTSLSIADLNPSAVKDFDAEKAWRKLSHVIKFTKSLQKPSKSSGLGPLIELDKNKVVEPPNFKLPPNLSHLCVDIEIPVGFRRLRWAMMSSKSNFLTQEVMEQKLGFSE